MQQLVLSLMRVLQRSCSYLRRIRQEILPENLKWMQVHAGGATDSVIMEATQEVALIGIVMAGQPRFQLHRPVYLASPKFMSQRQASRSPDIFGTANMVQSSRSGMVWLQARASRGPAVQAGSTHKSMHIRLDVCIQTGFKSRKHMAVAAIPQP